MVWPAPINSSTISSARAKMDSSNLSSSASSSAANLSRAAIALSSAVSAATLGLESAPVVAPKALPAKPSRVAWPTTPRMVGTSKPSRCSAILVAAASCAA